MRLFGGQIRDDFVPNSFAAQYLSIILIIITCIIWAFFSNPGMGAREPGTNPGPRKIQIRRELAAIPLGKVFEGDGSIRDDVAEAYVSFLSSHDLDAEFEIHLADGSLDRGFRLSSALSSYFTARGVPERAVRVFVVPAGEEEAVAVRLKTEGGKHS